MNDLNDSFPSSDQQQSPVEKENLDWIENFYSTYPKAFEILYTDTSEKVFKLDIPEQLRGDLQFTNDENETILKELISLLHYEFTEEDQDIKRFIQNLRNAFLYGNLYLSRLGINCSVLSPEYTDFVNRKMVLNRYEDMLLNEIDSSDNVIAINGYCDLELNILMQVFNIVHKYNSINNKDGFSKSHIISGDAVDQRFNKLLGKFQ